MSLDSKTGFHSISEIHTKFCCAAIHVDLHYYPIVRFEDNYALRLRCFAPAMTNNTFAVSIPVIDFTPWTNDTSKDERNAASAELVKACKEVGFAYIINHGVPQAMVDDAFATSKRLYDLSLEQKMKAPHPPGWAHHRGYSWQGLEKVSAAHSKGDDHDQALADVLRKTVDCKESYEIGSDQNLDQPNIWLPQSSLPEFRPFMTRFYWTCFSAASNILRALALGLGLEEEDSLLCLHSGHYNQLRLLHYPPVRTGAIEDGTMARMPAHTDWSSVSMLFQDDCGGLEIEYPYASGKFVPATPMKGALVMNVGDLLMRWSNDYLHSTSHRVRLPPLPACLSPPDHFPNIANELQDPKEDEVKGDHLTPSRYSIVYFLTTDPDRLIECLPACIDEEKGNLARYEPITQRDYAAMRAKVQY